MKVMNVAVVGAGIYGINHVNAAVNIMKEGKRIFAECA